MDNNNVLISPGLKAWDSYTKLNLKVNLCGTDFSFCLSGAEKKAIASKYPNVLVYLKEGKTGINAFRVDKVTAKRLTKLYGVIVQ